MTETPELEIGVLVPHFGATVSRRRILEFGPRLESLGFDALWVRDLLAAPPLRFEGESRAFVDPFVVLSAAATQTTSLRLGTAVLIPTRHPLVVAQLLGSLELLAGPGRLIVGVGAGFSRPTFEAVGLPFDRRGALTEDLIRSLRSLAAGPDANYAGSLVSFESITVEPGPDPRTPIWYGGSSRAGVRRALALCDGWMPGRCPFTVFDRLRPSTDQLRERPFALATIPCVVLGRNRDEAFRRVDVENVLADARVRPDWRQAADFRSRDDLAGAVIAGDADDVAEELQGFVDRGVRHLVLDPRFMADDFDDALEQLAREVVPKLRGQG